MSKYLTNERIFVYPCLSFIVAMVWYGMVWYGMVHIPFKEGHHHHQYHQLFISHSMTHSFVFERLLLFATENITQAAQHSTTQHSHPYKQCLKLLSLFLQKYHTNSIPRLDVWHVILINAAADRRGAPVVEVVM